MRKEKSQKLPRRPVEVPLNQDEQQLFDDMEIVVEENLEVNDFGRHAAKDAVQLVMTFLDGRGLSGQAMKPLIDVFKALEDVGNGLLLELFDPKASSNSGPDGVIKWSRSSGAQQVKLYAAACMSALMEEGGKDEAAARVARASQSWSRLSSGLIKASTVANWRDEFLQTMSNDPSRLEYEHLVRAFTEGQKANGFLKKILNNGPPLTGGVRRRKDQTEP